MKRKKIVIISLVAGILLLSVTPYAAADATDIKLPSTPVMMSLTHNWVTSYFLVTLYDVPDGFDVTNDDYIGWCADPNTFIDIGVSHQVTLYSSYGVLPSHLENAEWDKVNYIINHKQGNPSSWNYFWEIQLAIWYTLGYGDQGMNFIGQPMDATGWAMVNDAIEGYIPMTGEIIAIIADSGIDTQGVFFEISVPETYEGLTPGFWKNHQDVWVGYIPGQTLDSVFDFPEELKDFRTDTLIQALRFHGGPRLDGAARILLRAAVASLLNAEHPNVDFALSASEIISQVNSALGGDRDDMLGLAFDLDTYNNYGCGDL